jgi:pimeloyl-ACP methyl ester carboxylesterase
LKVVLLHAFPLDERMWQPQLDALGKRDVSTPRLYGRGRTMAAWADSIAAEVGGEFVLVGASMGGYCSLALAARTPEQVRGVFLTGSRPDADSAERRAGRADTIELIRTEGPEALWRSMTPKLFEDESHADVSLLYRDPDGLVEAVEAIRDREDSTGVARSLRERLQFVIGASDPFVSAGELGELEAHEVAGAGHLVNLERPDVFNRLLQEFLERV